MMKSKTLLFAIAVALITAGCGTRTARTMIPDEAIVSGTQWFDQHLDEVNAHGACIVEDRGIYYLFGEYKSDTTNAFQGFACYSSPDLAEWRFTRMALPLQKEGLLGPRRVGERPKVMRCPSTGEYVMYMHCDDLRYKDPHIGYATARSIDGPYTFQGALLMRGKPVRKWDMGTFQDDDGRGYIVTHSGFIYALAPDYKSIDSTVVEHVGKGEAPVIFKRRGVYYWLRSDLTSWERNDNFYYTATSLQGPWKARGNFAPQGSLTWNSQSTFVFPITHGADTTYMFMGDRWSYPQQSSAATYVWQPLEFADDTTLSLPRYYESWTVNTRQMRLHEGARSLRPRVVAKGDWQVSSEAWRSRCTEDRLTAPFEGGRVGVVIRSTPQGGYAEVAIHRGHDVVLSTRVDCYSLHETTATRFLSPKLPAGKFRITVTPTGTHPSWSDKRRTDYGSTDNWVEVTDFFVLEH